MYEDVIKRHKPRGWKLKFHEPINRHGQFMSSEGLMAGWVRPNIKLIECGTVIDRGSLYVVLHEFGHINCGHFANDGEAYIETAQHEYEAETYAIKAMRAEGIPVPRDTMKRAKLYVRGFVRMEPDIPHSECVLKFAYGSKWRKYR